MGYFSPQDFELFEKFGGKHYTDCPNNAHKLLRNVYDKLGDLVKKLSNWGFEYHIIRNPRNQSQIYEDYHWAKIYPKAVSRGCSKKVFFVVGTGSEGLNVHIDSNERDGYIASNHECAQKIKDDSRLEISVDELENLSEQDLINIIVKFCEHKIVDFLKFGIEFKIAECLFELNRLTMIKNLKANKNIILHGAPGTGKTFMAKKIAENMGADSAFVQFHPSYDYTDFVEGLRPYMVEGKSEIGFKRMDGVFKGFCKEALANPDRDYVFIIDEINRGDLSKIFGELFFTVDPGYRGERGRVKTQYQNLVDAETDCDGNPDKFSGDGFYIPENVYIIGTMNDIDRSVESMDFAMRRRFAFYEITAEQSMSMLTQEAFQKVSAQKANAAFADVDELKSRMRSLNEAIISSDLELSADYQIGAAYFLNFALYAGDDRAFEYLWDNHLNPVLKEYLRGTGNEDEKLKRLKDAFEPPRLNPEE